MKRGIFVWGLVLALAPSLVIAGSNPDQPIPQTHTVQPGESLSEIAAKYLWPAIYKNNKGLLSNPDLIYPGAKIQIPSMGGTVVIQQVPAPVVEEKRKPYGIINFANAVSHVQDAELGTTRAIEAEAPIFLGDVIELDQGVIAATLEDSVQIAVSPGSTLKIIGKSDDHPDAIVLSLTSGKVRISSVDNTQKHVVVYTNDGVFELHAKLAAVDIVRGVATRYSLYSGTANYIVQKKQMARLVNGQGIYVSQRTKQPWLVKLPKVPTMRGPGGQVSNDVSFLWNAVKEIAYYTLEFGRQKDLFTVGFSANIFDRNEFDITLRNKGEYFWTVRSVDKLGFESRPLAPAMFSVK